MWTSSNPCAFDVELSHETLAYLTFDGVIAITLNTLTGSLPAGGYRVYGGSAYGGPGSGILAVRDANVIYDSLGYGIAINLFVEGTVSRQVSLRPARSASRGLGGGEMRRASGRRPP